MTVTSAAEAINIANWCILEEKISLFQNCNELRFSVEKDGVEIQHGQVPLQLYEMPYAINLVKMFHKVIELNLADNLMTDDKKVNAASFLPVLCTDAIVLMDKNGRKSLAKVPNSNVSPDYRVALFGQVERIFREDRAVKEVRKYRWALYDQTQKELRHNLEDTSREMTEKFLLEAPRYNRPNQDERYNYQMSNFVRQFRVVYTIDELSRSHFVSLKYASRFDRNVLIIKRIWAATIIFRDNSTNHAEMAIEGIDEQGTSFIKFLHFYSEEGISGSGGLPRLNSLNTQRGKVAIYTPLNLNLNLNKVKQRTLTFKLPAENLQKIIDFAQWQIKRQEAIKNNWTYFNAREAHHNALLATYINLIFPVDIKSVPIKVKKFETYQEFQAYQDKHPALKNAFKVFKNRKMISIYPIFFTYQCDFDPYENWICSYELDPHPSESDLPKQSIPLNAKNLQIWIQPDNCITFLRRMLFLAGIALPKTSNCFVSFDSPTDYMNGSLFTDEVLANLKYQMNEANWRYLEERINDMRRIKEVSDRLFGALNNSETINIDSLKKEFEETNKNLMEKVIELEEIGELLEIYRSLE